MNEPFSKENSEEPASDFDKALRPPDFDEFVGQLKVKERLMLMVEAANQRGDALDHVLLSGPPGLGKTTLAHILAKAFGSQIHCTSGPQIEKAGDLAGILTNLSHGDFLFIDEIHRLHPAIEEYLYPAMEDFQLDIIIDQGPNARSVSLSLPPFTLIGATTRSGMLTAPLRSRFGMTNRLDYYTAEDLVKIINRSASLIPIETDPGGAHEIASRSRGTPRITNNLLRWVRDYAQVRADNIITQKVADTALGMLDIDADVRWLSRSEKTPPPSRTFTNPTLFSKAISSGHHAVGQHLLSPIKNSALKHPPTNLPSREVSYKNLLSNAPAHFP